ncbi:MAG: signal recognition particle protein [Verrucomicrobiaceae bacterium]|nr:signal recognition particle protein [Verrucomicrobiaceae bacterium]
MFSALTEKLEDAFKKLRGLGKISESNITDALKDIRLALLEADVDFAVTKDLLESVKTASMGQEVLRSIKPGEQIVKIFHDELVKLLGDEAAGLQVSAASRILIAGLNGAGKTTTSGKLAAYLKKQGKRPVLVALDLYRPAAVHQLQVLAQSLGVPVFTPAAGETDPVKAASDALKWVDGQGQAVVAIFDTAGRQEVDEALIKELKRVAAVVKPTETLLVADAATGQAAVSVAKTFHDAITLTGLIMTKLDGDARGGAVLSMRKVTGCPIKFLGVGEKSDQLEVFHPDRMAQRILGMGDVVSLVEKAAQEIEEKDAERMAKRMEAGQFDFNDLLSQMKMMKRLGPVSGIMGMLPGMGKLKEAMAGTDADQRMRHLEAMVLSMTPKERSNPSLLNSSRKKRIASGSGRSLADVSQLIKQQEMMQALMSNKGMMGGLMSAMMGGGKMPGMPGMGGGMPGMPGLGGFKQKSAPALGQDGKPKMHKRFKF